MNTNKKIQEKTRERSIRSRLTAVGIVLSIILALFVPYFEVLPVSAVSNGNWDDGVNYMEEAITQAHGFNLANNIDNVSFTIGTITYSSNGTGAVTVQAGSNDPVDVEVNMEYKFTREQMLESGVLTNGGYVYYQMNANIHIENPIFGVGRYVTDSSWSTTEPAGYYSISNDGLITICYTKAYLNHLKTSNDVVGTLRFNGKIQRKAGEDGDKNFDFGKVDVTVDFDDIKPQISKDCEVVHGDSYDLVWKIEITNPGSVVQMENYTLTDLLDGIPTDWVDETIEPEDVGTFEEGGTVTFTHQDDPPEKIIIKYTTKNVATNTKYTNKASLQKGDETPIYSNDKEVTIEDALEGSKYGQADYEIEKSIKDRIKWTINVRHKASDSLRNVVVTEDSAHPFDQAYESATSNNHGSSYVQVTDKDGQLIDSSKYTINGSVLTFIDDSSIPSEVNISFWAQETITAGTELNNNGNGSSTVSPVAEDISNTVSAGRDGLDTIQIPGTKNYDHSINLVKSLDNINYDEGTMMWQFTIETGGQNAKESVNGYKLTDPIFKHLTQDDMSKIGFNLIDSNGNTLASRFVNSNGATTSTMGDEYGVQLELNSDTITVRYNEQDWQTFNKIKLYYYTSIEDYIKNNVGEEALSSYQKGDSVSITNTATATNRDGDSPMSSTGTGTGELKKRVEASKSRTGVSDSITYSLGGDDTTDKVLSWYVHLTNDSGFPTGQVIFTDNLRSDNESVQHIMTNAQFDNIVVYGSHDYYADYSQLTPINSLVNRQKIGNDGNQESTGFTVSLTGGVTTEYHHLYIVYQSTARTSQITEGSVHFTNDYTIGNETKTADGLTYTREPANPAKTFKIQVNKHWAELNNPNRPETISFKVYRVLADKKGKDGVLPENPDWGEAIGTYTVSTDSTKKAEQFDLLDTSGQLATFPRWEYYGSDNTYRLYYYKLVEDPVPSGYVESYDNGDTFIVHPSESTDFKKTQNVKNTQLGEFKKESLDRTGAVVTKIKQSDLDVKSITIDGVSQSCYILRWKIWLKEDTELIYEDTMPPGTYFITGKEDGMSAYKPVAHGISHEPALDVDDPYSGFLTFTEYDQNHIKFKLDKNDYYALTYYTAIPIEKIDNVLNDLNQLTNTVTTNEGDSKSSTLQIVRDVQEDETAIEKSFTQGISAGYLNYSIAVNSNAKKYSNNGTIDITDNLFYSGGTKSAGDLSYVLEGVKVYEQKADGTADESKELTSKDYSYTVEYDAPSKDLTVHNYGATGYNQGPGVQNANAYRISGWNPGDKIGISITRNPEVSAYTNVKVDVLNGNFVFNRTSDSWSNNVRLSSNDFTSYQQITVPSGASYIYVIDQGEPDYMGVTDSSKKMIVEAVEASVLADAQLNLTVPDETPLIVKYIYKVTGWESTDTLRFTNTASFDEDNGGGSSTSYDNVMQISNSGGDVTTSAYPKIYKTNVNNYAINTLSSTFKVAKYDTASNRWVYANEITVEGSGDQQRRVLKFSNDTLIEVNGRYPDGAADLAFDEEKDEKKIHQFDLGQGTLYKFVEIKAPTNYRSPDWSDGKTFADNSEFVFYYAYDGYSGTIPDDAKGKVQTISNGGTINIPNSNMISLSAKKIFSGETLPANAEVELKLYWANSKRADMSAWQVVNHETLSAIPEGFNPVRIISYSPGGDNTALSWERLPSGHNGGSVYYFVKEERYTIDGVDYTYDPDSGKYKNGSEEGNFQAVYTGNGTNTDKTQIEVDNTEGLIVKKIWRDIDGNLMENAPEDPETRKGVSVNFTVYGVKNNTRTTLNLPVKALTEANNYTYKLPDRVDDTDGNSFALSYFDNYEIAETLTAHQEEILGDRFTVSTTRKIRDGTGTLEITNTDKYTVTTGKLQVEKDWLKNDAGDTESITVELYRQAYNSDGTPYVPPDTQQIQSPRSLPKGMFSMRRVQNALAETQTEVVEQTPVSMPLPKPRGGIKLLGSGNDATHGKYVSLDNLNGDISERDIETLCKDLDINAIGLIFNGTVGFCYNLAVSLSDGEITVSNNLNFNQPSTNTNELYLEESWFKQNFYGDGYNGIPDSLKKISVSTNQGVKTSAQGVLNLQSVRFYYTPVGPEITIQNPNRTIVKGDSFTLQAEKSEGARVTAWRSSNESVASIDNNGNITFHSADTVTITATATDSSGNTKDATIELTAVSGEDFEPSISPAQVHVGGTATLSADKTGVIWRIDSTPDPDYTGKATLSGATVTATTNGKVKFVGNRGDTEKTVTLEIVPLTVQFNGKPISSGNIQMNVLSSLPVNGVLGNVTYEITGDSGVVYYDPDTQTIKAGENKGTATITIRDDAEAAGSSEVTLTITTVQNKAEPEIPSTAEKLSDITITKDNDWKSGVIDELPLNDGNGHNYRYFIKETSTGNYIPIAYTSNGAELNRYSTTRLGLANAVEENEPGSTTLPESGGTGTRIFYTAGAVMLLISAAGYTMYKRRRWSDE